MTDHDHWTEAEVDDLMGRAAAVMSLAVDRNSFEAAMEMVAVIDRYGNAGVYSLCMCFAEIVHGHATAGMPAEARAGATAVVLTEPGAPEPSGKARALLWAARFVAAYANDDDQQTMALFLAPLEGGRPDHARLNVAALLGMAADLVRAAAAKTGGRT